MIFEGNLSSGKDGLTNAVKELRLVEGGQIEGGAVKRGIRRSLGYGGGGVGSRVVPITRGSGARVDDRRR